MEFILFDTFINAENKYPIQGIALIHDWYKKKKKEDGDFITGTLYLESQQSVPFKAWDNSDAYKILSQTEYKNTVVYLEGEIDIYNGVKDIVINTLQPDPINKYSVDQFIPSPYNEQGYFNCLYSTSQNNLSEKGFTLLCKILYNNEPVAQRFKIEFAASSHHDNCKNGLLAHTYKLLLLLLNSFNFYPDLLIDGNGMRTDDRKDLLVIGMILHDIGKIYEMNFGIYQPDSIVTHRVLGLNILSEFKKDIVETYGEPWYLQLQSIISQHHGAYEGENCRSVPAYIIHLHDAMEASLTTLQSEIQNNIAQSPQATTRTISIDKKHLTL